MGRSHPWKHLRGSLPMGRLKRWKDQCGRGVGHGQGLRSPGCLMLGSSPAAARQALAVRLLAPLDSRGAEACRS